MVELTDDQMARLLEGAPSPERAAELLADVLSVPDVPESDMGSEAA